MKKPKKFAIGGYTPKSLAQPMGSKPLSNSNVMGNLKSMAASPKPNVGPNASTDRIQPSLPKGFSPSFNPTNPRPIPFSKPNPFQGSTSPPRQPAPTATGPKPQVMGGSSNKMGPSSVKTGMPASTARQDVGIGKFMQDQVNKPRTAGKLKDGGAVKGSKRGDGIAQRGKTKCRMV